MIASAAADAIGMSGRFSLAVSGGKTPWPMFKLLGERGVDWDHVDLFQVDERVAPDGDPDRNLTQIRASLPDAALGRLRPSPTTTSTRRRSATRPSCRSRSTSSTSGSVPTGTPLRSSRATRCLTSPTGSSR